MVLNLIYEIEENWKDKKKVEDLVVLLSKYFQWFDLFNSENRFLKKMAPFEFQIEKNMSLRKLLDLAVPLERYLQVSVKDDQIFKINEGDNPKAKRTTYPYCFILDHLRSSFNVGSLFRTAECLGVEHIFLVGYTPTPEDKGVKKTAMGSEKWVSWSHSHHFSEVHEGLKKKGYKLIALETTKNATDLTNFKTPDSPLALTVGNERFGLSEEVLSSMDEVVSIPMMGIKNSLNVANSLSMASFEVLRQWKK